jgi:hypothetical protein
VVDYQPFDLGLFFAAWINMDVVAYPTNPIQNAYAQERYASARREAEAMYKIFRDHQKKVGVTDEQIVSASGMKKDHLIARLAFWTSQPKP